MDTSKRKPKTLKERPYCYGSLDCESPCYFESGCKDEVFRKHILVSVVLDRIC